MSQAKLPDWDEVVASAARVMKATPAFLARQRSVWDRYWESVRDEWSKRSEGEDSGRDKRDP